MGLPDTLIPILSGNVLRVPLSGSESQCFRWPTPCGPEYSTRSGASMIGDGGDTDPPDENTPPLAQTAVDQLIATLLTDYELLQQRLAGYAGSREVAAEILHDVYLKLRAHPQIGEVQHPRAYLYRMAINLTKNQWRNDSRMLPIDDATILALPDEAPDQERTVLAFDEWNRALEHLGSLPAKRRAIFLAKWRDEKTQIEIASDLGLHKRTVQKELDRAERFLRKKLWRPG